MKALLIFFLLCIQPPFLFAQQELSTYATAKLINGSLGITTAEYRPTFLPFFKITCDSHWHPIDTLECGIDTCAHDLVHSKPYPTHDPMISCAVYHPLGHRCSWTENHRKSICRKCRFHILESDYDPTPPAKAIEPEDEYEKLIKKQ